VEARGRDPKGEIPEGATARRGSARGHRVTAALGERTRQALNPSKPRPVGRCRTLGCGSHVSARSLDKWHGGQRGVWGIDFSLLEWVL
jgi:hypothetical protein